MNVIGYIRTAAYDLNGAALKVQDDAVRRYCKDNGLNLLEIFKDEGVSGLTFKRIGWFDLREYLRRNKGNVRYLIVPDHARISRDVASAVSELNMLHKKYGIEVRDVSQSVMVEEKTLTCTTVYPEIKSMQKRKGI